MRRLFIGRGLAGLAALLFPRPAADLDGHSCGPFGKARACAGSPEIDYFRGASPQRLIAARVDADVETFFEGVILAFGEKYRDCWDEGLLKNVLMIFFA